MTGTAGAVGGERRHESGNQKRHCEKIQGNDAGVVIPDGVRAIDEYAFYKTDVHHVLIPAGTAVIGAHAFAGCKRLASVEISDSVTQIGNRAFAGCQRLHTVIMGKEVKHIGKQTFEGCALKNLAIDPDNPCFYSDGRTIHCRMSSREEQDSPFIVENGTLKAYVGAGRMINIPPTVNRIGEGAFYNHPRPIYMNIHDGVTSIGALALCGCKHLRFINYTDSVTYIGRRAFAQWHHIRSISLPASLRANRKEYVERA